MDDENLDGVRTVEAPSDTEGTTPPADSVSGDTSDGGVEDMAKSNPEGAMAIDSDATDGAEPQVASVNGAAVVAGPSALAPAGSIRACPIPAGAVLFGELTSAFVDGARLLRFLGDRKHTGAIVDASRSRVQVAILHEGAVLGLVAVGEGGTRRLDRLSLPGPGDQEEHELSVLTYRPEVALALGQLINVPERFERMHSSFVDFPALLAFLRRESVNGAVRVTTSDDAGIVLLRSGEVLGAYTRQRPELDDPEVVLPLASAADAEIDVHAGALQVPPPSVSTSSVL
jgi:hypothetical protein